MNAGADDVAHGKAVKRLSISALGITHPAALQATPVNGSNRPPMQLLLVEDDATMLARSPRSSVAVAPTAHVRDRPRRRPRGVV